MLISPKTLNPKQFADGDLEENAFDQIRLWSA